MVPTAKSLRCIVGLALFVCLGACSDESTDDTVPVLEGTPVFSPIHTQPTAPELPAGIQSCHTYLDSKCENGVESKCSFWDKYTSDWTNAVSPMTHQAYIFDRYYDLYSLFDGQSMDIDFLEPMPAGTPESTWNRAETFERLDGYGDAAAWTGVGLWASAARYKATGTTADYERLVQRSDEMMRMYDALGIDGLLARSYFGMLAEGAPQPHHLWGKAIVTYSKDDGTDGHFNYPMGEALAARVPAHFSNELEIEGTGYAVTPRVLGDASRDQFARSLPGILMAYDLLGDDAAATQIKTSIRTHIPATLNRMKKGRIRNIQKSREMREVMTTFLTTGTVAFDPEALDPTTLDTIYFYILEQPHPEKMELYDTAVPSGPPLEVDAEYDFDADDSGFFFEFLALSAREQRQGDIPIAWSMHPNYRPSDLVLMLHAGLSAYYLTQNETYLEFIDTLLEESQFDISMLNYDAFTLPKWCEPHYSHSITYPLVYNIQARVNSATYPQFWSVLSRVMHEKGRYSELGRRDDPFFGVLYNRMTDSATDPERDTYVLEMVDYLGTYGMDPSNKLEPDRSYPRDYVTESHAQVPLEEIAPGDAEWTICEVPQTALGIEVPPPRIDGIPIRSKDPLPLDMRIGGTFLWQMDPWMVQRNYGNGVGMRTQWPGLGLTVTYWLGRADGVIQEGQDLVLAWQDAGTCTNP